MKVMTTTELPYTNYYLNIRRARNSEWQKSRKTILAKYTTTLKSGKVLTIVAGNMRFS